MDTQMRTALPAIAFSLLSVAMAQSGSAQTVVPVRPFQSVELRNGGSVIVRHGAAQRVTIVSGDPDCVQIGLEEQRLVIDHGGRERGRRGCSHRDRLRIEIVTPPLAAFAVSNGGTLQTLGAFPAQETVEAAVEQGGMVDVRSVSAGTVNASVDSGGRILTKPRHTLSARVDSGGAITYWGDVTVRKSVRHGGVVTRGKAADADRPLAEHDPALPPVPPIPPLPRHGHP